MPALRNSILSNAVGGANFGGAIENAIPGFAGLTNSATGIIRQLMSGLPSAAPTQRANAYFGANSGMPGSDFVRNRGFDLYGEKAEQYKQRGFQDLLALLQGYSGTVAPTTGQQIQSGQYQQGFYDRRRQELESQNNQEQGRRNNLSEYSLVEGGFPGRPQTTRYRYFR